jgi:CRISPR-associated protein Csm1
MSLESIHFGEKKVLHFPQPNALRMTDRDKVYLGALLHDIGKFYQRGDKDFKFTKHPILSAAFLNSLLDDDTISAIVANHQIADLRQSKLPEATKRLAIIVCEADSLASGERIKANTEVQQPLTSIFSQVKIDNQSTKEYKQPISSLTPKGFCFPKENWTVKELESEYEVRWKEFISEIEKFGEAISLQQIKEIKETLHALSLKYLWCIPSASYQTKPDISLHEHHRLAAAITLCMYDYLSKNPNESVENRSTVRYQLFCADLTGIQQYLYNIKPKGAAKALKGRSFFLQQILDSTANYILSKLNLERANLLYSSGGKFFLLLPNLNHVSKTIDDIEKEVSGKLLSEYGANVSVVFASVPLKGIDFSSNNISNMWDEVQKKLQENKKRKFSKLIKRDFFLPNTPAGELVICSATDLELCTIDELNTAQKEKLEDIPYIEYKLADKKIYELCENDTGKQEFISSEQFTAQLIGRSLRRGNCLAIGQKGLRFNAISLESFDIIDIKSIESIKTYASNYYLLNDDNFIGNLPQNSACGFRFYGGNWTLEGDYDDLVEKSVGLKRLGVLRLDVDNLGKIFKDGLGKEATFSRVIQLSTMLDFFFSSYLNRLADLKWSIEKGINETDGEDLNTLMQIVYSGGDDVFIIGVWNVLPDVAIWIYDNFKEFTCQNPCFTLSAGISLFDARSPLYKAALDAGIAEDKAKGKRFTKNGEKQKDAICFLDTPMSWSDFKIIRAEVIELYKALASKKISRSFIQRLLSIYNEYEQHYESLKATKGIEEARKRMLYGRWRWLAAYSLARFAKQYKDYEKEINTLASKLFLGASTEQDFISLTNVLAQWADFLTRKEKA